MPWLGNGTFQRVNGEYSAIDGSLWQQDLQASIKIIASRHDFQDEDLATGIAACLNLDGLNAMRANLDMGGYKLTNLGTATGLDEVPTYGQTAGGISYSDTTKVLTLTDRNGADIDTTTIDLGTVGAGVTSIAGDGSLNVTPDPITGTGTIGMNVLATGQTYQNGIQAITIDDYGRVTQVTAGAFNNAGDPDQSLSVNQNFVNSNQITITKQADDQTVTLFAASNIRAGVMSSSQAAKLADIPDTLPSLSDNNQWFGEQNFDGDVDMLNVNTLIGSSGLPGLLDIGISVASDGAIIFQNIPTSATGLATGQLYSDGGTLKIAP